MFSITNPNSEIRNIAELIFALTICSLIIFVVSSIVWITLLFFKNPCDKCIIAACCSDKCEKSEKRGYLKAIIGDTTEDLKLPYFLGGIYFIGIMFLSWGVTQ